MPLDVTKNSDGLKGHALRNANLRKRSLARADSAPPLARAAVRIRAETLEMTRVEFSRRSGISRGVLRDLELGVHRPTHRTLRRFLDFCRQIKVSRKQLAELSQLYAGAGDTLEEFLVELELKAGSHRNLARQVRISPSTLWEYRRGNFPLPIAMLRKLCRSVKADFSTAEVLWQQTERQRLIDRGYPEAWAELNMLCARAGHTESGLLRLGLTSAAMRRLRYLELPSWDNVAEAARLLCRDETEWRSLKKLWQRDERERRKRARDEFGPQLKQFREQRGIKRRTLADLFAVKGDRPAQVIRRVEEHGVYSMQAYPAGLTALVVTQPEQQSRLLERWRQRRRQFHRRRRPEMRIDLRLARELYGYERHEISRILGYSNLEYQRIERGVEPLLDSARERILSAIHEAGLRRVAELLMMRSRLQTERSVWRAPPTMIAMVELLAQREGGLVPLARFLNQAGLAGSWTRRLRAIARGHEVPTWRELKQIGMAGGVLDLSELRHDWRRRFRAQLESKYPLPLGVELRLLIAEVASTLREFVLTLPISYSLLLRDLQRINRGEPNGWRSVERILNAAGLPAGSQRWTKIRMLWAASSPKIARR